MYANQPKQLDFDLENELTAENDFDTPIAGDIFRNAV